MDCLPSPTTRMGCRGLFLTCGPPTPDTNTTSPTPHTWTPCPPRRPLTLLGICPAGTSPAWTRCCGWGRGRLGGWGCGRGRLPRPSSPTPPGTLPAGPPTCPFHPTFISRSAPASDLAVIEVGCQCMLFFVGSVHQLEVAKGGDVDAESEIHFALSGIAPRVGRPRCGTW